MNRSNDERVIFDNDPRGPSGILELLIKALEEEFCMLPNLMFLHFVLACRSPQSSIVRSFYSESNLL